MKFSITREALQSGLGAVAAAIPTRTTASTVIHSVNKVEADMASDGIFRNRVRQLQDELFQR